MQKQLLIKTSISTKFQNYLIKLLVAVIHGAMAAKKFLKGFFLILITVIRWTGRRLLLPVLIRLYKTMVRIRRALRPAERRLVLIAAHRGILHAALVIMALMTAGGNIYAQTQAAVSSGEGSVLYKYMTGDEIVVEGTTENALENSQYFTGAVNNADFNTIVADGADRPQGDESDVMIELGALMPEIVPGSKTEIHRTQTEEYIVKEGDTLSGIASKFGVSIATILWENKLTVRDFIKPGQKLIILPASGITYTVASGDTVVKIAVANGVSPEDIKSWNNIADEAVIAKGQKLFIPGGKITPPPAPKPKPKTIASPAKVFTKPPDAINDDSTNMAWPANTHNISQPYGIWSRVSGGIHSGVDLAGPTGTTIYAADDGIVTHASCGASCKKSYGLYVDIDHGNGIMTRYGHASKLLVSVGEQVRRGQAIALMGSTGRSTGPHLHFEVRLNGRYTNPLPYIR